MASRIPGTLPNPVDVHVGKRIKARRQLIHVSQEDMAHSVGVTFQQVQKYESGDNRVSASRLYQIARTLNVSVSFFFEGLDTTEATPIEEDPMRSTQSLQVLRRFYKLHPDTQKSLLELMETMHLRRLMPEAAE